MSPNIPSAMRALSFEDGNLRLETAYPVPQRPEGETLIRVTLAGLCATDIAITKGYMDFTGVPGHEFVGVVVDADDESLCGKRVLGGINAACGNCDACSRGEETHCPNRTVLGIENRDGAFAEYLLLPGRNLVYVPDGLGDDSAVFAEPLAAALRIVDQVEPPADGRAAVIGDGRLGLLVAQVLSNTGCGVDLFGRHPERVDSLEEYDISHYSNEPAADSYDFIVECSGSPGGLAGAYSAVKPLGVLVLKSTYAGPEAPNPWQVVVKEISVIGSRCGDINAAVAELAAGRIRSDFMIEGEWPLEEVPGKLAAGEEKEKLKILIRP